VPFRDTRAAGVAHDHIGSNTNMPVAGAAVPTARPYRGSSLDLLMVQKGIIIRWARLRKRNYDASHASGTLTISARLTIRPKLADGHSALAAWAYCGSALRPA
jgi:hypothetical protein